MSEHKDTEDIVELTSGSQAGTPNTPDLKDPYERFIWENRQKFGALSWSGLLRYGRGIVLMDARGWPAQESQEAGNETTSEESASKEAQLAYLPEGRISALSQTPQKKDALSMLRTYNPREEIIVNILRADGGSFFQIALKDSPPPEAYRTLMGSDEFEPRWKDPEKQK